jgi:hypothetical protein
VYRKKCPSALGCCLIGEDSLSLTWALRFPWLQICWFWSYGLQCCADKQADTDVSETHSATSLQAASICLESHKAWERWPSTWGYFLLLPNTTVTSILTASIKPDRGPYSDTARFNSCIQNYFSSIQFNIILMSMLWFSNVFLPLRPSNYNVLYCFVSLVHAKCLTHPINKIILNNER